MIGATCMKTRNMRPYLARVATTWGSIFMAISRLPGRPLGARLRGRRGGIRAQGRVRPRDLQRCAGRRQLVPGEAGEGRVRLRQAVEDGAGREAAPGRVASPE